MEEKRKYPRVSSNFALEVVPSDSGSGTSQNVSEGGMLFEHEGPIELGSVLNLTLRVPGLSGTTSVKGKVVRCEKSQGNLYNIAVNFLDIEADTAESIREMLESF